MCATRIKNHFFLSFSLSLSLSLSFPLRNVLWSFASFAFCLRVFFFLLYQNFVAEIHNAVSIDAANSCVILVICRLLSSWPNSIQIDSSHIPYPLFSKYLINMFQLFSFCCVEIGHSSINFSISVNLLFIPFNFYETFSLFHQEMILGNVLHIYCHQFFVCSIKICIWKEKRGKIPFNW